MQVQLLTRDSEIARDTRTVLTRDSVPDNLLLAVRRQRSSRSFTAMALSAKSAGDFAAAMASLASTPDRDLTGDGRSQTQKLRNLRVHLSSVAACSTLCTYQAQHSA